MKRIAGLFPGQGSQAVGMGSAFCADSERARSIFVEADRALAFSLSTLCFAGPLERLTLTEYAQPAILTVSYIAYLESGVSLAAAAGHSLGEYTALLAAGCLSFSDAVTLVHKRGRYMQEAVPAGEGKMLAVLGPSEAEIRARLAGVSEGIADIANLNSPGQTVVAGDLRGINAFAEAMKAQGAKLIELNVSAPFHCRLMKPAMELLAKDLDATTISDPRFPVYANVTAAPVTSAAEVSQRLKEQVCASVRWTESMLNTIEREQILAAVEFGAGSVLAKLLKRIARQIPCAECSDPQTAKAVSAPQ